MRRAALSGLAVLAAISGPAAAQDVDGDTLDICSGYGSIESCLDHVADDWNEWGPHQYQ